MNDKILRDIAVVLGILLAVLFGTMFGVEPSKLTYRIVAFLIPFIFFFSLLFLGLSCLRIFKSHYFTPMLSEAHSTIIDLMALVYINEAELTGMDKKAVYEVKKKYLTKDVVEIVASGYEKRREFAKKLRKK